jgi:hypothetical protein
VVSSPLGPILNNLSSNLSSRSNHKPDPCLVSQARLALEEGEVRVSRPFDMFLLPLSMIYSFSTQLLDLVEGLVKIHNSNLSKRTQCLETSPPIPILHLQQAARRLVCYSITLLAFFLLTGPSSGAFGGSNNNPSMFNNTKPATGFGAFGGGGSSAFGTGGGAFGSATPSQPAASNTGLFGQSNATGSAFGTGTFANKPAAASAFGPTACASSGKIPVLLSL